MYGNKVFDLQASMERVDGDKDFLIELIEICLADAPKRFEDIEAAIAKKDPKLLDSSAHAVKSALGNVGAMSCHAISFSIEKLGKAGTVDGAAELLKELRNQLELYRAEYISFKG